MATIYSDVPDNLDALKKHALTGFSDYKTAIESAGLVVFYDTCAIQHHAGLSGRCQEKICGYLKNKNGIVIITNCVLMELSGDKHHIHSHVIRYFETLAANGIKIILFEESHVYDFLIEAYQSAYAVNEKLRYAVRCFNTQTSTIKETVKKDGRLTDLVGDGAIPGNKDICEHFFSSVRSNKQAEDNLGEQLIGICVYMMLHLPAEPTCKFTVYTDDRWAAGIICRSSKSIPPDATDKRPGIFSSAKLFQDMCEGKFFTDEDELTEAIKTIYPANIRVLALMEKSDLNAEEYVFTAEKLSSLLFAGHTIRITF